MLRYFLMEILQLLILTLLIYIIYLLTYSMMWGAPYAPLGEERIKRVISLLKIKKGQKILDLGSGDGRVVIALAKHEAKAYGFEINPIFYLISRFKARSIQNAHFKLTDFWQEDLSSYDAITLYGITHMMPALEKKLRQELKPGTLVVSNHFKFPHWKIIKKFVDVYLYTV